MPDRLRPEQLLAALLELIEEAVLTIGIDGTIEKWSPGAEALYGYTAAEMAGEPLRRLVPLYETPGLEALLNKMREGELLHWDSTERLTKTGMRVRIMAKRVALRDGGGKLVGVLEKAQALEWAGSDVPADTQLRLVAEQMPALLWTADRELRITSNWGAGQPWSRIRPGALTGHSVCEFLECVDRHAPPVTQHYEALQGKPSRFEYSKKDRSYEVHVAPLRAENSEIVGCMGLRLDITDRKKTEDEIRYQSTHDALTGLANYREFMETLEREVRRTERNLRQFTVLLVDLDDLKGINDRLGHLAGNRALKRIAAVLKEQSRGTDVAARYGGDEFGVVLIDSDLEMAQRVVNRIEARLQKDTEGPQLSVSIGVGLFPADGRNAQELLEVADRQLYQRKKQRKAMVTDSVGIGRNLRG
ncbi:MAG TPA: sensor domain-containing diguanylate cyclase [Candidatus Dormibacteraeota bacterium]|nr:sensor domain-containing diguanylate cyclase [Candidatus Dormibacteraeota bacterium]